jgi:hypothetical protein
MYDQRKHRGGDASNSKCKDWTRFFWVVELGITQRRLHYEGTGRMVVSTAEGCIAAGHRWLLVVGPYRIDDGSMQGGHLRSLFPN